MLLHRAIVFQNSIFFFLRRLDGSVKENKKEEKHPYTEETSFLH